MNEKKYITVKEFAAAAGVSNKAIYQQLSGRLKEYCIFENGKKMIDAKALELFYEGVQVGHSSVQVKSSQLESSLESAEKLEKQNFSDEGVQVGHSSVQVKSSQLESSLESAHNAEIEALKMLVDELKQDKEELKKDKEYLQQELVKWQSLLLEEKEKVKLLEAAATEQPQEPVEAAAPYTEIVEQPAEVPPQEPPQSFIKKLKWLFKS